MAFFNKPTQTAVEPIKNDEIVNNQQALFDITQLEKPLYELASTIMDGKHKNRHLIEAQQRKLDELKKGLENIEFARNATIGQINSGSVKDSEVLKDFGKQVEEYNGKMLEQKGLIDRLELDIMLLQQEKDQAAIDDLLQKWNEYEKGMFSQYIAPMETEIAAIKDNYFNTLKELRSMYTNVERLAKHLNESLGDGEKVFVHSWFNAVQMKPELQITKHDEQKEEVITHSYLAE